MKIKEDKMMIEVRKWKRAVSKETAKMTTKEAIAYFRAVGKEYKQMIKRRKAA